MKNVETSYRDKLRDVNIEHLTDMDYEMATFTAIKDAIKLYHSVSRKDLDRIVNPYQEVLSEDNIMHNSTREIHKDLTRRRFEIDDLKLLSPEAGRDLMARHGHGLYQRDYSKIFSLPDLFLESSMDDGGKKYKLLFSSDYEFDKDKFKLYSKYILDYDLGIKSNSSIRQGILLLNILRREYRQLKKHYPELPIIDNSFNTIRKVMKKGYQYKNEADLRIVEDKLNAFLDFYTSNIYEAVDNPSIFYDLFNIRFDLPRKYMDKFIPTNVAEEFLEPFIYTSYVRYEKMIETYERRLTKKNEVLPYKWLINTWRDALGESLKVFLFKNKEKGLDGVFSMILDNIRIQEDHIGKVKSFNKIAWKNMIQPTSGDMAIVRGDVENGNTSWTSVNPDDVENLHVLYKLKRDLFQNKRELGGLTDTELMFVVDELIQVLRHVFSRSTIREYVKTYDRDGVLNIDNIADTKLYPFVKRSVVGIDTIIQLADEFTRYLMASDISVQPITELDDKDLVNRTLTSVTRINNYYDLMSQVQPDLHRSHSIHRSINGALKDFEKDKKAEFEFVCKVRGINHNQDKHFEKLSFQTHAFHDRSLLNYCNLAQLISIYKDTDIHTLNIDQVNRINLRIIDNDYLTSLDSFKAGGLFNLFIRDNFTRQTILGVISFFNSPELVSDNKKQKYTTELLGDIDNYNRIFRTIPYHESLRASLKVVNAISGNDRRQYIDNGWNLGDMYKQQVVTPIPMTVFNGSHIFGLSNYREIVWNYIKMGSMIKFAGILTTDINFHRILIERMVPSSVRPTGKKSLYTNSKLDKTIGDESILDRKDMYSAIHELGSLFESGMVRYSLQDCTGGDIENKLYSIFKKFITETVDRDMVEILDKLPEFNKLLLLESSVYVVDTKDVESEQVKAAYFHADEYQMGMELDLREYNLHQLVSGEGAVKDLLGLIEPWKITSSLKSVLRNSEKDYLLYRTFTS